MDQFQAELMETIRACQSGEVPQPGDDPFADADNPLFKMADPGGKEVPGAMGGKAKKPAGLEHFTHEQLLEMAEQLAEGKVPEALNQAQVQPHVDADGNPIIDEEGGAVIQPNAGFVVKTKDMKSGAKVFINVTHHSIVEGIEDKAVTPEEQAATGASVGVRIPLSLGNVREETDKSGNPVQAYDFIFNTETVK